MERRRRTVSHSTRYSETVRAGIDNGIFDLVEACHRIGAFTVESCEEASDMPGWATLHFRNYGATGLFLDQHIRAGWTLDPACMGSVVTLRAPAGQSAGLCADMWGVVVRCDLLDDSTAAVQEGALSSPRHDDERAPRILVLDPDPGDVFSATLKPVDYRDAGQLLDRCRDFGAQLAPRAKAYTLAVATSDGVVIGEASWRGISVPAGRSLVVADAVHKTIAGAS